jgi:MoaA/NifB/PqqE/SkfB family radical SAM enzyme
MKMTTSSRAWSALLNRKTLNRKTLESYAHKYITNFRYAFRIDKPRLTLRLVKTFAGILLLKKQPLRYVDFALSYNCNLRCQHCFATALEKPGRNVISPAEYKEIVAQAMALGAVNFSFQGGEPLLNTQLLDYVENAYPDRNVISVTTNGTLLDEQRIRALKRAGVDILSISLDSALPEEHDTFRGVPGTYAKTIESIKLAKKNGLNVTIGAVASHQNVRSDGFLQLIDIAKKLDCVLFVALAAPQGNWENYEEILLTPDDRAYLQALEDKHLLLRTDFAGNFVHQGCGAVKEILYITSYGDVLPCPFLHLSMGNVLEEPLAVIRSRGLGNPYFDHYHHQCLAAEDHDFIKEHMGAFYGKGGAIRRLQS